MTSLCLMPVLLAALPVTITFDSAKPASETRIAVADLGAGFPRDWSGHEALVLEVRASSPQRINLKVHVRGGAPGKERASRVVFHPYPGVWLRAAIPVSMLAKPPATGHDMAAVGNRSRSGYFLSLWGPFVPLTDVEAIGFEMEDPIGSPTLEVRSVRLEKTSPGDAVLDGLPVVDALGQYAHGTWPGKAGSVDDLQKAWRDEDRDPSRPATSASAATGDSPPRRRTPRASSAWRRRTAGGGSSTRTATSSSPSAPT